MSVMGWTLGIKVMLTVMGVFASIVVGGISYSVAEESRVSRKGRKLWFATGLICSLVVSLGIVWGMLPNAYYGQARYIGVEETTSHEGIPATRHFVEAEGRKLRLSGNDMHLYNEGDMVWVRCSGGGLDRPGCKLH